MHKASPAPIPNRLHTTLLPVDTSLQIRSNRIPIFIYPRIALGIEPI